MSTGIGIHGLWGLESQPITVAPPRASIAPYRFEEKSSSRHYDILSSSSSSEDDDDDLDESFDDLGDDDFFSSQSSLEAAGIERGGADHDNRRASLPVAIRPKTEESSRDLRRKSRRCAAEQSRDDAWERRRQMEELKLKSQYSRIARSQSDCGQQQPSPSMLDGGDRDSLPCPRSRSLTEEDFEELRGCIDLGFRFNVDAGAEKEDLALCNTLPALEVCYAANRQLQDLQSPSSGSSDSCSWQIANPGEELQQVKEKLKHWARAVACISKQSC